MNALGSFEGFYLFSVGGNVRGVSIRIFISLSGVSFNVLMHQNECPVGSGISSGQLHLYPGFFWL